MLSVFLKPAFTPLGHNCQNLLSPCDGMHTCVHRLDLRLYSRPKEFLGGMESEPITKREKSPLPEKNSPQRRIEPITLY